MKKEQEKFVYAKAIKPFRFGVIALALVYLGYTTDEASRVRD